jgi:hypothetical protein
MNRDVDLSAKMGQKYAMLGSQRGSAESGFSHSAVWDVETWAIHCTQAEARGWLRRFNSVLFGFDRPPGWQNDGAASYYVTQRQRILLRSARARTGVLSRLSRKPQVEGEIAGHDQLMHVGRSRSVELAIDCHDIRRRRARRIIRLIDDLPEDVSARRFAVHEPPSRWGVVTALLCDAERLGFDAVGIRHVAETLG